jgi:pSer/pThr/pTyr-binding forkhead associated (FHA) protein
VTPLSDWLERYRADPLAFARALCTPVLWIEPRDPADPYPDDGDDERSLHTSSGVGPSPLHAEPMLAAVQKHKDNAFRRGITVGRTPNNDLVIDDGSVSRFHAWFGSSPDGGWSLSDAGSKNGTFISVKRLAPRKPHPLEGGEKVRFGSVDAWFLLPPRLLERFRRRSG